MSNKINQFFVFAEGSENDSFGANLISSNAQQASLHVPRKESYFSQGQLLILEAIDYQKDAKISLIARVAGIVPIDDNSCKINASFVKIKDYFSYLPMFK